MISAIVLTKNEEKNIQECLKSLSWCDEIIVIDDNSNDKTLEIAKNQGARVYQKELTDFSDQRNFAQKKAKHDWILFVDADERISSALWYEIMQNINDPAENPSGFYLKRIDRLWGKDLNYGDSGTIKLLRLAKKGSGKWVGKVHERWDVFGRTECLNNPLHHLPHQSIPEFLSEINHYTTLRSEELFKQNKKTNIALIIIYPVAKFIHIYFLKLGILDGIPGLISALMMSFHSFLVRSKLWLLLNKNNSRS